MRLLLFIIVLLAIISCKEKKQEVPATKPLQEATTDQISELYNHYIANPTHQYHINENALIDYAVEHDLAPVRMDNGVYIHTIKKGDGDNIAWKDPLVVHYRGTFLDGKEFDSSYKRGKPIEFRVGQMIQGWNYALETLTKGSKAILLIPSQMAYGEEGLEDAVPPNTNLVFEIEILDNPIDDK